MLFNGLALIVFFHILLRVHSETIDPDDCKIVFYYGPSFEDSVSYPLTGASEVAGHPKFTHEKTVFFIPDYYEAQIEEYYSHHVVDAHLRSGNVNMLFIDWGGPLVSEDQVKELDLDELVPRTAEWLAEMHQLIDWNGFHVLAYAKGVEFISNVVHALYSETKITIRRITTLAPPQELIVNGEQIDDDEDLITDFIDAIHTDIGQRGSNFSRAHVDFYPNGGTAPQPGCPEDGLCSRRRSFLYYAESVNNPNAFCGYMADSYKDFESKDKAALGESIPMGRRCPRSAKGKYYLETNDEQPFGKGC